MPSNTETPNMEMQKKVYHVPVLEYTWYEYFRDIRSKVFMSYLAININFFSTVQFFSTHSSIRPICNRGVHTMTKAYQDFPNSIKR